MQCLVCNSNDDELGIRELLSILTTALSIELTQKREIVCMRNRKGEGNSSLRRVHERERLHGGCRWKGGKRINITGMSVEEEREKSVSITELRPVFKYPLHLNVPHWTPEPYNRNSPWQSSNPKLPALLSSLSLNTLLCPSSSNILKLGQVLPTTISVIGSISWRPTLYRCQYYFLSWQRHNFFHFIRRNFYKHPIQFW